MQPLIIYNDKILSNGDKYNLNLFYQLQPAISVYVDESCTHNISTKKDYIIIYVKYFKA